MNIYFPPKHWKPLKNDLNHGQVSEKNRNRKNLKLHTVLKGIQLKLTPNSLCVPEGTLLLLAVRKSSFFGPVNHSLQLLRCKCSADLRFSEFCDFQWSLQEGMYRSQTPGSPLGLSQVQWCISGGTSCLTASKCLQTPLSHLVFLERCQTVGTSETEAHQFIFFRVHITAITTFTMTVVPPPTKQWNMLHATDFWYYFLPVCIFFRNSWNILESWQKFIQCLSTTFSSHGAVLRSLVCFNFKNL